MVSFDRTFDYAKLLRAFRAVHGTSARRSSPPTRIRSARRPDGGLPDCAAMLAAVEACTGARAEAVLGKPSPQMAAEVLRTAGRPGRRARRWSATAS